MRNKSFIYLHVAKYKNDLNAKQNVITNKIIMIFLVVEGNLSREEAI